MLYIYFITQELDSDQKKTKYEHIFNDLSMENRLCLFVDKSLTTGSIQW